MVLNAGLRLGLVHGSPVPLRSAPAQKPRPAPVRTATRNSPVPSRSNAASIPSSRAPSMAFSRLGRFNVTQPIWLSRVFTSTAAMGST
ncbi:hypothetical protein C1Y40_01551 [Mycobacterium talmoniae]|uniref:Uncharacterized protein n=1 Tax=Mycobacterium talmoniae TaxID=1858794 RepID=A0A2S8BNH1_9MYCO|nr:hypothetical protein C1Y40_01551 [Mycobacterium talmoniae]